jgi:hypothetical protein
MMKFACRAPKGGFEGLFAACLLLSAGSAAAQEWHVSDFSEVPAALPDVENDGPGNFMDTSSCNFVMPQGGGYDASLLLYSQQWMTPYASARIASPAWEQLNFSGQLDGFSPNIEIALRCIDPNDSSYHQDVSSGWQLVGYDEPTPNFECPVRFGLPIQAWCRTAAFW